MPVYLRSLIPKMSTFSLAISYLATSNLPWFMDLTFQVPMQYCSLQHRTLLPSPVTSTTGCFYCFGSVSSFFLELFLHWSSVAYWVLTYRGSSSFSVLSFAFSYCSWGSQAKNSPVDHILSELSTKTHLLGWPYTAWLSFTELDKAVVHVIRLVFCDCGFESVCPLMETDKRLMEASWWERLTEGELGLVLKGGVTLSKSLI